jgi:hypothetical protein
MKNAILILLIFCMQTALANERLKLNTKSTTFKAVSSDDNSEEEENPKDDTITKTYTPPPPKSSTSHHLTADIRKYAKQKGKLKSYKQKMLTGSNTVPKTQQPKGFKKCLCEGDIYGKFTLRYREMVYGGILSTTLETDLSKDNCLKRLGVSKTCKD